MLTLEDKKLIAKWMGWKPFDHTNKDKDPYYLKQDNSLQNLNDWNPDENHEQFGEICKKLTTEQFIRLLELIDWDIDYILSDVFTFVKYLLYKKNLPKICKATIAVIKESEGKDV